MLIGRILGAGFVVLASFALAPAADVPEKLLKEIEKTKSDYEEGCKAADKKLLEAFDAEKELIRKQAGLKAEARQKALEAIDVEKDTFEKQGTIPLSLRMRTAAMNYVKANRKVARPTEVAYDKAIEFLQKAKDDSAAAELIAQKKKVLSQKVAVSLLVTTPDNKSSWTTILFMDGTSNHPSLKWTLEKDKLVHVNTGAGAPAGGWVDTCLFEIDGQRGQAKNQKGSVLNLKRIDPPK